MPTYVCESCENEFSDIISTIKKMSFTHSADCEICMSKTICRPTEDINRYFPGSKYYALTVQEQIERLLIEKRGTEWLKERVTLQ